MKNILFIYKRYTEYTHICVLGKRRNVRSKNCSIIIVIVVSVKWGIAYFSSSFYGIIYWSEYFS